jgi:glyoxylase-like metal-dependent hydrolase (beta-lactamase superfamily II)
LTTGLQIDVLALGPAQANCYILRAGGECWVVDPGWSGTVLPWLEEAHAAPSRILLTHGHGDHIGGVTELKEAFPQVLLCCPEGDADMLGDPQRNLSGLFFLDITAPPADELLQAGRTLNLGEMSWLVLDTSGHTPGGVSFYCPQAGVVLTGDALFQGSVGRTDFPGASSARLIRNIVKSLLSLPDDTKVLAGHGASSTIGREKLRNPYLPSGSGGSSL